jgi:hypothetical protein
MCLQAKLEGEQQDQQFSPSLKKRNEEGTIETCCTPQATDVSVFTH